MTTEIATPTSRPCETCGQLFESVPLIYGGRVLVTPRNCEACVELRDRAEALERQQRDNARLNAAWDRLCPPLYRDTSPERLPCPAAAQAAILDWKFGPQGLLVHGPARGGKTRLIYLLLHRLHIVERRKLIALTSSGFSHQVSILFGEGGGRGEAFVKDLTEVPVLFIDDIGKGRLTDRVESEFFHVIETLTSHLRPTILTTNLTAQALRSMWSADRAEPLLGRFQEFFRTVGVLQTDQSNEREAAS